jgi:hypothetical protein
MEDEFDEHAWNINQKAAEYLNHIAWMIKEGHLSLSVAEVEIIKARLLYLVWSRHETNP